MNRRAFLSFVFAAPVAAALAPLATLPEPVMKVWYTGPETKWAVYRGPKVLMNGFHFKKQAERFLLLLVGPPNQVAKRLYANAIAGNELAAMYWLNNRNRLAQRK